MSGTTMDVLPVLTPRFLQYQEEEEQQQQVHFHQHQNQQIFHQRDNTHLYLTDLWSNQQLGTPQQQRSSPSYSKDGPVAAGDDGPPMWISPNSVVKFGTASPTPLPNVPSVITPTSSSADPGPPSVIHVRIQGNNNIHSMMTTMMMMMPSSSSFHGKEEYFFNDDDEVSALADNPDDDDVDVLPHATYDVLANIFDQIYKDESEVDEEEEEEDYDEHDSDKDKCVQE
mmetsp:Transcript_12501/g.21867  ORF Transcript_12501/g.21867 Transcript_12501/m.21867 type:complete len:227 (-) Transcript_12501:158-838(-)